MSTARGLLAVLLLVVIGGATALLLSSSSREEASPAPTVARAVTLRGYDAGGTLAWVVQAEEGAIESETGTLSHVEIAFYKAGEERLRAQGATLTYTGNESVLKGGVDIVRADGYRLSSEELAFAEKTGELTAGRVEIRAEGVTVEAQGLRYHVKEDRWSIAEGFAVAIDRPVSLEVVGRTIAEEEGRLILQGELAVEGKDESYTCDRIDYDKGTELVRLSGDVEGTFSAGTIRADSLTLTQKGFTAGGGVHLLLTPGFFGGAGGA